MEGDEIKGKDEDNCGSVERGEVGSGGDQFGREGWSGEELKVCVNKESGETRFSREEDGKDQLWQEEGDSLKRLKVC